MAISVTFNSVAIDGAQDWREIANSRITESVIPRKDGSECESTPMLESRTVVVNGVLSYSTSATLRTALDSLISNLNTGTQDLTCFDDRHLHAVKRNFDYKYHRTGRILDYSIEFLCKDPLYSSNSVTSDTANTTSPIACTVLGNAKTFPSISITAVGGTLVGITLENTHASIDNWFTYSGTIASTKTVTIDCEQKTLIYDSTPVDLTYFLGEFWQLAPNDSNSITVTPGGTSTGTYSIDLSWYTKWY